ncbi:MAG: cell division protein ZapE, partial [Proteobacteria bacterium]|nr:cell division protein ZapE [Pseudomonadota bacterium]
MNPSSKYLEILQQSGFVADQAQQNTLALFDRLQNELEHQPDTRWWQKISPIRNGPRPPRGIYLWGGVGRGK